MGALAVTVPAWTLSFVDPEEGAAAIARAFAERGSSSLAATE
jgi:hypothetical protein